MVRDGALRAPPHHEAKRVAHIERDTLKLACPNQR
jgi:hypothetical protein